jgi:MarR family transcriptional regulator for hemolysin
MSRPPLLPPIGLRLTRTARLVTNAFERAMAEAGDSASTWQVLLLVRSEQWGTQSRMAQAMGITGATLTHHLNALEARGLVHRWREAENRRVQHAALTPDGEALFARLREVAMRHDQRLRCNLTDKETILLAELLEKLQAGIDQPQPSARHDPNSAASTQPPGGPPAAKTKDSRSF